ncbi:MAG: pyridoxamine 5'-phosphate oxidase [Bacteroidales bacterium]|nr:pyridoxamine 5'-phosphate oxidase [Bacteroidales bacterium]
MTDFKNTRNEYNKGELLESEAATDPFKQFESWFAQAKNANVIEPTAMVLSTVKANNTPASRTVLLKGFDKRGFRFFTNFHSQKGYQLDEHPFAALLFFWGELERQVRIEGKVEKLPAEESDEYFGSRPRESRIGALASPQSQIITSRDYLEERKRELEKQFEGTDEIPRPENWGGYRVTPNLFEFWQGRRSRLHDRLEYRLINNSWRMLRLAP